MAYTVIGCLFLVLFGLEIAYFYVWLGVGDSWVETEPLEGVPVTYNDTGHMVPAVSTALSICAMLNKRIDYRLSTLS